MMKKIYFFALAMLVCVPAIAAVRCVNPGTVEPDGDFVARRIDWEWYQADPDGARFTGMAICSDKSPSGVAGATASYITQSTTITNNVYCYCRLINPIVSKWTYYQTYATTDSCVAGCSESCVYGYSIILEQL